MCHVLLRVNPAEMGASQAASKLIMMDADTRNSIIENMAPRAAANTLTSMEDAMQALASEPGSPEVRCLCCPASLAEYAIPAVHLLSWVSQCRMVGCGKASTKHLLEILRSHFTRQALTASTISVVVPVAGRLGLLQMLTLNGGTSDESPVMGAISDLDPNNAYTIMSYMSIKVSSS